MVYRAFERLPAISWRGFRGFGLAACKTLAAARFLGAAPVDAHPCSIFRTAHCVPYQRQPTSFPARNLIAYMNQEAPWGCSACEGLALPTRARAAP